MSTAVCLGAVAAFSGDHASVVNGALTDPCCTLKIIAKCFLFSPGTTGCVMTETQCPRQQVGARRLLQARPPVLWCHINQDLIQM